MFLKVKVSFKNLNSRLINRFFLINLNEKVNLKSFISFFLLISFSFPTIIQVAHLANEHNYDNYCTSNRTHIHKYEQSCILNFVFKNPFTSFYSLSYFIIPVFTYIKKNVNYQQNIFHRFFNGKYLRAPPIIIIS